MAEITIDNVRKSFGALEVLHGVSAKADVLTNDGCGLPTPLKVTPDPESGWTFEAEAQFNERGLCEAAHRIKGHLAADPPKLVPGGGIEPP